MTLGLRGALMVGICLGGMLPGHGWAQDEAEEAAPVRTSVAKAGKQISRAEYVAQLKQFEGLVEACRVKTEACDAERVGPDESVDGGKFEARWYWLRDALSDAKDGKKQGRLEGLARATQRLQEDEAESGAGAAAGVRDGPNLPEGRKQADAVLRTNEFAQVQENSYWARQIARFYALLDRAFSGLGKMIPHSAWYGALLEWGTLGVAAGALLLWAWRTSKQQRVVIATERTQSAALWQKESEDWAQRAQGEAQRGEWREAVHSLYWSAIVVLEGQKLWRQNRSRTPREYVRLLESGSAKQQGLRALTGLLERIWYGLRPAGQADYDEAYALLDQLRAR